MAHGFKSGGRSIGTPNKLTTDFRQMFSDLLYANFDTLQADLSALEPKDRIRALIDISKFVVPTIKAIEIKEDTKEDNHFTIHVIRNNEDL
jgi:hypothetical protein